VVATQTPTAVAALRSPDADMRARDRGGVLTWPVTKRMGEKREHDGNG
jgi:hypothetical protein